MHFTDIVRRELDEKTRLLDRFQQEIKKLSAYRGFSLDVKTFGNYSYYSVYCPNHSKNGGRDRRYVGRKEADLVCKVKTYCFLERSIKILTSNIRLLQNLVANYSELDINTPENRPKAYRHLPAECYKIAGTIDLHTWETQYRELHHIGEYRHPENLKQKTEDGGLVRSKSEAFIYNRLCNEKLSFLYEMPWKFNGYMVEPDFTVLSRKTGQLIIWEHLGLLSSPDYVQRTQWKLRLYQNAGFILGDNLILSTDTEENGIDTSEIRRIITEYLL